MSAMPLRWRGVLLLFIILILLCALVGLYSLPSIDFHSEDQGLRVSVFAPQYVSADQEEEIRFAIENQTDNAADVTFNLIGDRNQMAFLARSGSNEFYSGQVRSKEQIDREVKVFFPRRLAKDAGLSVSGTKNKSGLKDIKLPIYIAPVPKAKALTYYLFAAWGALGLWISKEWWEQMKKQLDQNTAGG
jgi:multidrug efflux pump subunit AcrB